MIQGNPIGVRCFKVSLVIDHRPRDADRRGLSLSQGVSQNVHMLRAFILMYIYTSKYIRVLLRVIWLLQITLKSDHSSNQVSKDVDYVTGFVW